MPTHCRATLTDLTRDSTTRLITLTLDDGTAAFHAALSYRQAAQLGFWLKPGQRIELTGDLRDNILHITQLVLVQNPAAAACAGSQSSTTRPHRSAFPVHPRARALFGLPPRRLPSRDDGTNLEYAILVPILFVILLLILKYCQ